MDDELREIVRLLPDVLFRCVKDAEGRIVWTLNEGRLAEEFGLTTEKVRGKTLDEMFPPQVAEHVRPHFEAAFRGESAEFTNILEGRHFKHFPQPVFGDDGKVVAVVGFITEVTELVAAQEANRQLTGELLERVVDLRETNRRIEEANDALARVNADLQAFASALGHDLRGPLTVVTTQAHLLSTGHADPATVATKLQQTAHRMDGMLTDLVGFCRAVAQPLELERVDVSKVAREVVSGLPDVPENASIEVADGISVTGDARLVRVMLVNLIGNAVKYSGAGKAPVVKVIGHPGGFAVQDNGIGFDPEEARRLFEPFKRLSNAQAFSGTGIGLATVARIVARHGGTVDASGRPDEGATFTVTLPAVDTGLTM